MPKNETPPNPYDQSIRADLTWFFRDLFGMPHATQSPPIVTGWEQGTGALPELVDFFVAHLDPSYISHSGLQEGRAVTETSWSPELSSVMRSDLSAALGPWSERGLLVARSEGRIVGVAVVAFYQDRPQRHAVVEDLLVAPEVRRQGLARRLLDEVEGVCRATRYTHLYFESGVRNTVMHEAASSLGFRPVSTVFVRDL